MDPISLAIVSALAGGALSGAATPPFADAYNALKELIMRKFGQTGAPTAIDSLEKKPESPGRQETLSEEFKEAGVDRDEEIVRVAQKLLEEIKGQPGGEQRIMTIAGNYNAQADRGSFAQVNVNRRDE